MKANKAALVANIKGNPNSRVYQDIITLLEFKLATTMKQLLKTNGDETLKLQGRGQELQDLLDDLTRKPIEKSEFKPGGFGG